MVEDRVRLPVGARTIHINPERTHLMDLFRRKSESSASPGTSPRTGQPIRTDAQFWNDLATDADRRAVEAGSKEGRKAMERNARDFRRNARRSR